MIHDIDESLRSLLEERVVRGANIDIAFDLPNNEWAAKRQGPALNLYLYDIREDLDRRQVMFEPQYNADGIVTSRQTPPRKFKLEYLATAGALLETLVESDEFPPEHLQGRAATVGPVKVSIALPLAPGRSLSDMWSAMGGSLRPALDVVVTLPLGVRVDPHVGPPVLEGPKISVLGPDGQPVRPMGRAPAGGGAGAQMPSATPADAAEHEAATVPAAAAAVEPLPSEVVDASRFRLGRRVEEIGPEDLAPGRRVGITAIPRPRGSR